MKREMFLIFSFLDHGNLFCKQSHIRYQVAAGKMGQRLLLIYVFESVKKLYILYILVNRKIIFIPFVLLIRFSIKI